MESTSPGAKVILVSAPGEERWGELFRLRFEAAARARRSSIDLVVEPWSTAQLATGVSGLGERESPVALLLLLTDSLIKSLRGNQTSIATIGKNVLSFGIRCEPLTGEPPWLPNVLESLGPSGKALSRTSDKDIEKVIDDIVDTVMKKLAGLHGAQVRADTDQLADEGRRSGPASSGTQPLARLSEFKTVDSIAFLMKRAAEMATGATPPNAITTSFMLFAIAESTDTEGPWTPHFLLEALKRHSPSYEQVRDRYFESQGVRGLIVRGCGRPSRPASF